MPASDYILKIRAQIGHDLLLFPAVVGVIFNEKQEILLQWKGEEEGWSLPAGGIEPGETPQKALIREVWEETGLWVVPEKLLAILGGKKYRYQYPNGDKVEATSLVFQCKVTGGSLSPTDPETQGLAYFDEKAFPETVIPYPVEIIFGNGTTPYWDA